MGARSSWGLFVVIAVLALLQVTAADSVVGRNQYLDSALDGEHRAELASSLPQALKAVTAALNEAKTANAAVFTVPSFQRDRVEKRMFMADRLVKLTAKEIACGDVTGLCRAEEAIDELKAFVDYFRREREAWASYPLNPAVEPVRLRLSDFKAKGDGVTDDYPAFTNAFAAVKSLKGRPSVLEIPEGEFLVVGPGRDREWHLLAIGLTNCVVTGVSCEKTRIVFGRYDGNGWIFPRACNTTLRNVKAYLKDVPFSVGRVEEVSRETGAIVVRHQSGTLKPNDARFRRIGYANSCVQFDARKRPIRKPVLWYHYECDDLGDGRYRMYFDKAFGSTKTMPVDVGATFVYPDRDNRVSLFSCPDSAFFTYESIWVCTARSGAFSTGMCLNPSCVNCRISPLRDDWPLSTNADAFFCAPGAYISGCRFANMNDDGCNSHNYSKVLERQIDDWTLEHAPYWQWLTPGTLAQFVRSTDGFHLGNARVRESKLFRVDGVPYQRTVFDRPLPKGLKTWGNIGFPKYDKLEQRQIYLGVKKVRDYPDQMIAPLTQGVGFVCVSNSFSNLRGVAIQIQCSNAYIEGNRVENVYRGLELSGLLHYSEGPAPYNVYVVGNRFTNVNRGIKSCNMCLNASGLGTAAADSMYGVTMRDNVVENCSERAYVLRNLDAPEIIR